MIGKQKLATVFLTTPVLFVLFGCCLILAAIHYVIFFFKSAESLSSKMQKLIVQIHCLLLKKSVTRVLDHYLHLKQFGYSCLHQFNLIANKKGDTNIIPDTLYSEVQTPENSNSVQPVDKEQPKKNHASAMLTNNNASENLKSKYNKQIIKNNQASLNQHQHKNTDEKNKENGASFSSTSMTHKDDWILVNANKKHKKVIAVEQSPKASTKSSKKKKRANKKTHTERQITTKPSSLDNSTVSWSSVASSKHEYKELKETGEPNDMDVPCLSDSDSIATSSPSGSPCLSSSHLLPPFEEEIQMKYYSPFSSGFDFGASFQQPQQPHKKSLLDLLNQTDHVKTTITANSFKYFDDMMMSTSLYKTNQEPKLDPLMIKIKRDWNSIPYCT
ncbi:hypothetical protein CU098_004427 [Rhizopus stolonifer]|uniref:Uncharacterized protein n=1 Tax=Rhizopus stolonifer TaxID=4846 RepID=A0A367KB08_RHIST|nr:hypothetical protein CU098_004427 [Rhizopus stolonifer]